MKQKYFLLLRFINLSMINFTHLKNSFDGKMEIYALFNFLAI